MKWSDLIGKRIAAADVEERESGIYVLAVTLSFDDGTAANLIIETGYDAGDFGLALETAEGGEEPQD